MIMSLNNNKCLNSVLKLWLPLMWLTQPDDFKLLQKQFQTLLVVEILYTQYKSAKLYIQEVNLWLPLPKKTKNVVTIFGNHFQQIGVNF